MSLKRKICVRDIKTFLPFSINLDPYIKKVIKDEYQLHEELNQGHQAPLTQRQAAGLSRKLSTDPASKGAAAAAAMAGISPNQVQRTLDLDCKFFLTILCVCIVLQTMS